MALLQSHRKPTQSWGKCLTALCSATVLLYVKVCWVQEGTKFPLLLAFPAREGKASLQLPSPAFCLTSFRSFLSFFLADLDTEVSVSWRRTYLSMGKVLYARPLYILTHIQRGRRRGGGGGGRERGRGRGRGRENTTESLKNPPPDNHDADC